MDNIKIRTEFASFIGKLLRDTYGKGPESVFINFNESVITIYLRQFISPMEKALMMLGKDDVVQQTRDILMKGLIPEIKATVKILLDMDIKEFYFDWGMDNYSAIMVGITSEKKALTELNEIGYSGKEEMHQEIITISKLAQKTPEELLSFYLSERVLVVIRQGILVSIEKELIRMDQGEILMLAKRRLEKRLLHNSGRFEKILNKPVIDIYANWDFNLDKSVFVFILEPQQQG